MATHRTRLVGGLEHFFIFPYIGDVIIPTDELIFFRGVGIPPTRKIEPLLAELVNRIEIATGFTVT